MNTAESLSPEEKRAYDLIVSQGDLLQSHLWKELDADSRKGSRLASSLAEQGFIERKETTSNGRRTYLLTPADTAPLSESTDQIRPQPTPSQESADGHLTAREQRGLALIKERGGIYQSEFWKELEVDSRTGSRIATGLEEKEAIRREITTYNGQRTYFLQPTKKDLDFSLLMAGDMISPFIATGGGELAVDSDEFTQWILELAHEEP